MNSLEINCNSLKLTDDQFFQLCQDNGDLRFERNSNGDIDIDKRLIRAKEEMAPSILEEYDFIIINDRSLTP